MKTIFYVTFLVSISTYGFAQQLTSNNFSNVNSKLAASDTLGAINELRSISLLDEKPSEIYHSKGLVKYLQKDYVGAIGEYTKAVSYEPFNRANASIYYNRAIAKEIVGRKKDALDDYLWAIEVAPDHAESYFKRGNIFSQFGIMDRAIESYTMAITLKADYNEAYLMRGSAYGELSNYKSQIKDYNTVIKHAPQLVNVYFLRGSALFKLGDYQAAVEDLTKAVELNPENAEALQLKQTAEGNLPVATRR